MGVTTIKIYEIILECNIHVMDLAWRSFRFGHCSSLFELSSGRGDIRKSTAANQKAVGSLINNDKVPKRSFMLSYMGA